MALKHFIFYNWLLRLSFISLCILPSFVHSEATEGIDFKKVQQLKFSKLADYFDETFAIEKKTGALDADVQSFIHTAKQLGVFPSNSDFLNWWNENKGKFLKSSQIKLMRELSVSEFTAKLFLLFTAEQAILLDKADPDTAKKRKNDEPTAGDTHFVNTVSNSNQSAWGSWLLAGAAGFVGAVAVKAIDVFFHGPVAQIMNTSLEPIVRPVRERIDLIINTHLAPHLVPWAQFVTGENRRRKRALKQAQKGDELSGSLTRYMHPAISVEAFTKDTETFYNEMLKADYRWRGWIAPELARARSTGFELLYHQYRLLGEQLTGYQNAASISKLLQAQINLPALLRSGASQVDIDELAELVRQRHDLMVYKDVRDPQIAEIDPKITLIIDKWIQAGIAKKLIDEFYQIEIEGLIANDRPAFLMASVLDGERYFQENNLALKDMPKIQEWQEQARETTGFYVELEKHQVNIQAFFDKRGLKYDVQARIAERGYPLGGSTRPDSDPVVKSCPFDLFKKVTLQQSRNK